MNGGLSQIHWDEEKEMFEIEDFDEESQA